MSFGCQLLCAIIETCFFFALSKVLLIVCLLLEFILAFSESKAFRTGSRRSCSGVVDVCQVDRSDGGSAEELSDEDIDDLTDIGFEREDENSEITDYELIRVIGRGSYSTVLMAERKQSHEVYAIKVITKSQIVDEEDLNCIYRERYVLHLALCCDFLVGIHTFFQNSSNFFFVIDIAHGGDMLYLVQRKGKLQEEHARFYAAEICLAVDFLHRQGIVYRDLKLDNVLLDHTGHIKVTDYGMCKGGIDNRNSLASSLCGTPNYFAPEMIRRQDYGFSVDWWALGVLLYEMLAGRSPFSGSGDDLIREILANDIVMPSAISTKACHCLEALLNRNPAERLGCDREKGVTEIQNHPFFNEIDWTCLSLKLVTPPWKPELSSQRDFHHFDPEFTSEHVELPQLNFFQGF